MNTPTITNEMRRLLAEPIGQVWGPALSLMHHCINEGWRTDQAVDLLNTSNEPLAAAIRSYCEFRQGGLTSQIERWWVTARARRREHAQRCGQARWTATRYMRHRPDTSETVRTASTDLAVLLGLYDLAEQRGRLDLQIGVRDISEAAGVGSVSVASQHTDHGGVLSALKRLSNGGLIERSVEAGRRGETKARTRIMLLSPERLLEALLGRWTEVSLPLLPFGETVYAKEAVGGLPCVPRGSTWHHVLWENGVLGMTAGRVWHLAAEGLTAAEMADRLGSSTRTVRDQLKKLASEGLYDLDQRRVIERNLDEVAAELGVTDRRAHRGSINAIRRKQRLEALERRSDALALFRANELSIGPTTGEIMTTDQPILASDELVHEVTARILGFENVFDLDAYRTQHMRPSETALRASLRAEGSNSAPEAPLLEKRAMEAIAA